MRKTFSLQWLLASAFMLVACIALTSCGDDETPDYKIVDHAELVVKMSMSADLAENASITFKGSVVEGANQKTYENNFKSTDEATFMLPINKFPATLNCSFDLNYEVPDQTKSSYELGYTVKYALWKVMKDGSRHIVESPAVNGERTYSQIYGDNSGKPIDKLLVKMFLMETKNKLGEIAFKNNLSVKGENINVE